VEVNKVVISYLLQSPNQHHPEEAKDHLTQNQIPEFNLNYVQNPYFIWAVILVIYGLLDLIKRKDF
jgi:uncharacterized protein (DUF2249 family)